MVAPSSVAPDHPPWYRRRPVQLSIGGLLAVALLLSLALANRRDAFDHFWQPFLSSSRPILLCVGNVAGGFHIPPQEAVSQGINLREFHHLPSQLMLISDASTLAGFAGLFEAKGKDYRVISQTGASFDDLQTGPTVLIGLFNNDWTERLAGGLRFVAEHPGRGLVRIRDRESPSGDHWSMDYTTPYMDVTRDYALVLRAVDPKTEQTVVTAAGLSLFGTQAAGEFLTNPREFRKIESVAPDGWEKMNFELVLATDVIRGHSGPPSIVAAHFW